MRYHPVERRRTISTVAPAGITSFTALLVLTFARRFSAVVVVAVAAAADRGWKTIAAAAVDRSSAATMNRLANLAQPIATTVARGVPTTSTTTELPVTAGRSSSRARCGDATMHPVPDHRLAAIAPEANRDSGISIESMRSMRDSRPRGRHPSRPLSLNRAGSASDCVAGLGRSQRPPASKYGDGRLSHTGFACVNVALSVM